MATTTHRPARHADPEIQALYVARRKAATAANGSGMSAMRGWAELESVESQLRSVDPDGDWRFESRTEATDWKWAVVR